MEARKRSHVEMTEELNGLDWKPILKVALHHAKIVSSNYGAIGVSIDPNDLVQESIALLYGVGKNDTFRNWDKNKYPDIKQHIKWIINSISEHKYEHACKFQHLEFEQDKSTAEDDCIIEYPQGTYNDVTPEDLAIIKEHNLITNKLINSSELDKEEENVVTCILLDITTPKEISEELGISVKDINNIKKRIARKIMKKITMLKGGSYDQ